MPASRALMLKSFTATVFAAGLMAAPFAMAQAAPVASAAPVAPAVVTLPTTLSLSVTGEVSAAPDMATISFAVVTQGKTASEAMKANNVRMNAVMASLKASGIATKDIQTSNLSLNPQYVYKDNTPPTLTGYEARNQITVRVNDLSQTGPVIDAVIKAGINQIDNIGFGLKDDDAVLDQARQKAVTTLNQRANLYASATGLKIKRLLSLEEGASSYQPPMPMMDKRVMGGYSADMSTPVAGGELKERVTITATFELEK